MNSPALIGAPEPGVGSLRHFPRCPASRADRDSRNVRVHRSKAVSPPSPTTTALLHRECAPSALCSDYASLSLRRIASEENGDRVQLRARQAADPIVRMVRAGVTEHLRRAAIPCRNSSGNVASDASSTPSARNPFQVNATVTQRFSMFDGAATALADGTFSLIASATRVLGRAAETKEIHIAPSAPARA